MPAIEGVEQILPDGRRRFSYARNDWGNLRGIYVGSGTRSSERHGGVKFGSLARIKYLFLLLFLLVDDSGA